VVAGLAGAAGMVVGVAAPAQAAQPPGCYTTHWMELDGTQLSADFERYCDNSHSLLPVQIQQQDPATGAWHVVATGTGWATYNCVGTAPHEYQSSMVSPASYACG
jgi:hypothetical protein